jgi:hypothetical protein
MTVIYDPENLDPRARGARESSSAAPMESLVADFTRKVQATIPATVTGPCFDATVSSSWGVLVVQRIGRPEEPDVRAVAERAARRAVERYGVALENLGK